MKLPMKKKFEKICVSTQHLKKRTLFSRFNATFKEKNAIFALIYFSTRFFLLKTRFKKTVLTRSTKEIVFV